MTREHDEGSLEEGTWGVKRFKRNRFRREKIMMREGQYGNIIKLEVKAHRCG